MKELFLFIIMMACMQTCSYVSDIRDVACDGKLNIERCVERDAR